MHCCGEEKRHMKHHVGGQTLSTTVAAFPREPAYRGRFSFVSRSEKLPSTDYWLYFCGTIAHHSGECMAGIPISLQDITFHWGIIFPTFPSSGRDWQPNLEHAGLWWALSSKPQWILINGNVALPSYY